MLSHNSCKYGLGIIFDTSIKLLEPIVGMRHLDCVVFMYVFIDIIFHNFYLDNTHTSKGQFNKGLHFSCVNICKVCQ